MATTLPKAPFNRAAFLKTVPAPDRPVAARLCDALERAYGKDEIILYSTFPVVIRDGEWYGGFAMRASGPMAYCCCAGARAKYSAEMKPFMSGKGCMKIKATKTATVDDAIALVERVWIESAKGPGCISKGDAAERDRDRKRAGAGAAAAGRTAAGTATAGRAAKSTARGASKATKAASTRLAAKPAKKATKRAAAR